jgi:hypothetical protein
MRLIAIVTLVATVVSCGPISAQISSWNEPVYRKLSCPELAQEGRAISKRGFKASGLRAGQGGSDATLTASAIVLVWPAPTTEKQRTDNLALADGQMKALEQASISSQCSIQFQRPPSKG